MNDLSFSSYLILSYLIDILSYHISHIIYDSLLLETKHLLLHTPTRTQPTILLDTTCILAGQGARSEAGADTRR